MARRNRSDGRYTFDGNFDRLCKCGRALGRHMGEAPHPYYPQFEEDWTEADTSECPKFRPAK